MTGNCCTAITSAWFKRRACHNPCSSFVVVVLLLKGLEQAGMLSHTWSVCLICLQRVTRAILGWHSDGVLLQALL